MIEEFVALARQLEESALPWVYWLVLSAKVVPVRQREFEEIIWATPRIIGDRRNLLASRPQMGRRESDRV